MWKMFHGRNRHYEFLLVERLHISHYNLGAAKSHLKTDFLLKNCNKHAVAFLRSYFLRMIKIAADFAA